MSQRPSDLVEIRDRYAAFQFDAAIMFVGAAIENAAAEMQRVGSDESPRWEKKYTMTQLLDPEFRLPRDTVEEASDDDLTSFAGRHYDEVD